MLGRDFDGGRSAYGFGIKKSTNGGGNWAGLFKTELKGYSVHRIMIDPDDPSIVTVAAGNNPFNPGKIFGLRMREQPGPNSIWLLLTGLMDRAVSKSRTSRDLVMWLATRVAARCGEPMIRESTGPKLRLH